MNTAVPPWIASTIGLFEPTFEYTLIPDSNAARAGAIAAVLVWVRATDVRRKFLGRVRTSG